MNYHRKLLHATSHNRECFEGYSDNLLITFNSARFVCFYLHQAAAEWRNVHGSGKFHGSKSPPRTGFRGLIPLANLVEKSKKPVRWLRADIIAAIFAAKIRIHADLETNIGMIVAARMSAFMRLREAGSLTASKTKSLSIASPMVNVSAIVGNLESKCLPL